MRYHEAALAIGLAIDFAIDLATSNCERNFCFAIFNFFASEI